MPLTLSLVVEIALSALLCATLIYCIVLERKLAALRSGQDGLKATISELNAAIASAGTSMRLLRTATAGAAELLDERLARSRALSDELSLLIASGERIADRIDRGTPETLHSTQEAGNSRTSSGVHPAALANRLAALRLDPATGEKLRNVR